MDTLQGITEICLSFKAREYGIEEFQSRLETLMITDDLVPVLAKVRSDAAYSLENIRFTRLAANYYACGVEVADTILKLISQIRSGD